MKKILILVFSVLFVASTTLLIIFLPKGQQDDDDDIIDTDIILLQYFDQTLPTGTIEFTHGVLDMEDFDRIIPLGQINPPGHTFPTDHIYFVTNGLEKPVYAPTAGKILFIEEAGMYGDGAIRIAVTSTMTYYLGHIFALENLQVGDTVLAGDQIGISGNTSCVDFGVLNKNANNGFLNSKMPLTTLYAEKPLTYYSDPLQTQLYSLVKPPVPSEDPFYVYDGGVTDGEFMLDLLGTLKGNWFKEGCFLENGWYEWTDTLCFGYDVYYPNQIRIGVGDYNNGFALKNEDNPIDLQDVTTTSGAVAYYLYNANNTSKGVPFAARTGLMMVQMINDTKIKIEIFDDTTSTEREFTSAAIFYVR